MDPITQGLLGAMTSQLGFRRKLGRSATWVAAATAIAPDLDIFIVPIARWAGMDIAPFDHLRYHRGITHSLLAIVVLAAIAAGLWYAVRRRQFWWLFACTLTAGLSHPLLDVFTAYGTQVLAPFTDHRFAFNAVPIIDLLFTSVVLLTLIVCWLTRRLRGVQSRGAILVAWIALGISFGYLAGGRLMHNRAIARGRAAIGQTDAQIEAYPALGTIFVWRVVARTDEGWHVGRTHLLFNRPVTLRYYANAAGAKVDLAWANEHVQTFAWFAGNQLRAVYTPGGNSDIVDFHDMRYGMATDAGDSLWMARVVFDDEGRIQAVHRMHNFRAGRGASLAADAWREMFRP